MLGNSKESVNGLTEGRVSLIVPCYNVERYIARFFDSIISQSYSSIELILINDGSTDSTRDVIQDYLPRLNTFCDSVRVIDQANRGLAGAVDSGLRYFTGEFLSWPDPDDWLLPNSLERRVRLLQSAPKAGVLRTNARRFIDRTGEYDGHIFSPDGRHAIMKDAFMTMLARSTFFAPVCHFVRSDVFLRTHPERDIYVIPNASQNLQMLLPIVQQTETLEVDETLAVYRVREDSRSQINKLPKDRLKRQTMLFDLTINTLRRQCTPVDNLEARIEEFYRRKYFIPLTFQAGDINQCKFHLKNSSLSWPRKAIVKGLIRLPKRGTSILLGTYLSQLASRAITKCLNLAAKSRETKA